MNSLDPYAREMAGHVELDVGDDPLGDVISYTTQRVADLIRRFGDIEDQAHLLHVVAGRLRVDLQFIDSVAGFRDLKTEYGDGITHTVKEELNEQDTEGLLLNHPGGAKSHHDYLAVVDARGSMKYRAYFSAWHELTHVIITPHLLQSGVRRTPPRSIRRSKPVESIVDRAASRIAFYSPIFQPVFEDELEVAGSLTYDVIRRSARKVLGEEFELPPPSLYAATLASLRTVDIPACFLTVDMALKAEQERTVNSPQLTLEGLEGPEPEKRLRVQGIHKSQSGKLVFEIFRNMRVPHDSVLHEAFERNGLSGDLEQRENQSQWETSVEGPLPPLPMSVQATRRGSRTYGLLLADEQAV